MAKSCSDASLYESLKFCKGTTVLPGIRQVGYFIPKDDITKWPTLPSTATTDVGVLATYNGSFTTAADKKWHRIDFTLNKGQISAETQGDIPARTFLNKATLYHPEIDEIASGVVRQMLTDDIVYLVQLRNGKWRVLGNESFPTDTKPQQQSGEGTSGDFGTTLEIEVTDVCPAPYYTGTLTTDDGEIDCSGTSSTTTGE